ncbi:MAG: chemotaxis protein CheX [Thermoguttaceae bacterium]
MSLTSSIPVEFVNPFIGAVVETFATMADCAVRRGAPVLKQNGIVLHPVSGVIGLSSKDVVGTVVLTMSEAVALHCASVMLMSTYTVIDADVIDAVGELTNIVAGNAKAQLESYHMSLSMPNVLLGAQTEIVFPKDSRPITIPFETQYGGIAVEVGFAGSSE